MKRNKSVLDYLFVMEKKTGTWISRATSFPKPFLQTIREQTKSPCGKLFDKLEFTVINYKIWRSIVVFCIARDGWNARSRTDSQAHGMTLWNCLLQIEYLRFC